MEQPRKAASKLARPAYMMATFKQKQEEANQQALLRRAASKQAANASRSKIQATIHLRKRKEGGPSRILKKATNTSKNAVSKNTKEQPNTIHCDVVFNNPLAYNTKAGPNLVTHWEADHSTLLRMKIDHPGFLTEANKLFQEFMVNTKISMSSGTVIHNNFCKCLELINRVDEYYHEIALDMMNQVLSEFQNHAHSDEVLSNILQTGCLSFMMNALPNHIKLKICNDVLDIQVNQAKPYIFMLIDNEVAEMIDHATSNMHVHTPIDEYSELNYLYQFMFNPEGHLIESPRDFAKYIYDKVKTRVDVNIYTAVMSNIHLTPTLMNTDKFMILSSDAYDEIEYNYQINNDNESALEKMNAFIKENTTMGLDVLNRLPFIIVSYLLSIHTYWFKKVQYMRVNEITIFEYKRNKDGFAQIRWPNPNSEWQMYDHKAFTSNIQEIYKQLSKHKFETFKSIEFSYNPTPRKEPFHFSDGGRPAVKAYKFLEKKLVNGRQRNIYRCGRFKVIKVKGHWMRLSEYKASV